MYYKKLNIENFERIQETVVPYILNYIEHNPTEERLFYNLISDEDLKKFKQDIPELFEGIRRELGSEIIFASHLFVDVHTDVPIHTDSNNPSIKKRIRLNWPILNGTSASTVFYQKKSENIRGTLGSLSNGVTGHYYDLNDCNEVDKYLLDTPTLMNVKELHGIQILNYNLPRVLLSMRLSNEEEVYQKYF
jgi:hypothetical protein